MTPATSAPAVSGIARSDVWRRHPADVARLVLSLTVLAALVALAALEPDSVRNASADLVRLVRRLPTAVTDLVLGVAQLSALLAPIGVAIWLATRRRFRLVGTALAAGAAAGLLMALLQGWLDRTIPPVLEPLQARDSWLTGAAFPSGTYLAAFTATVVVLGAASTHRWRRVGWILVTALALLRIAGAVTVPVNASVTVALGAAVASAALVALGAPTRRIGTEDVRCALEGLGIDAAEVAEVDVGAVHSRTFRTAAADDAPGVFVKLVGWDERAAEALQRFVRAVRVRGIEDEGGERTASRIARQEALNGLMAAQADVRVPRVVAVGQTPEGDGLVALEPVEGRRLRDLPPEELTDDLLRQAWVQLGLLHRNRIAHRWFDASSLLVDDDGTLHVLDLRWAVLGADDGLLAIDVVDLACSLALLVGPERAVAASAGLVPEHLVRTALPLTQPLVLSPATRRAVRADKGVVAEVRTLLAASVGEDEVELAAIARLSVGRVVGWVGTAVLAYVALTFVSNWSAIVDAIGEADWSYVPPLLALSVLGYLGGALSMMGAVPRPLPLGQTVEVMYAQSFLNRFTPANAGGMALRARYLQAHGSDLTVAAASVGLTSAASGVLQVVLLALFGVWAGSSDSVSFDLPDMASVALVVFGILVVLGIALASSWGRRVVVGRIWPTLRRAVDELQTLAKSPSKLALLFGGAGLGKLATIVMFTASCRAFDLGTDVASFAHLGLLYMTANTVASAAPTPGGVGAIEAALVAVLTGLGIDPAEALSIVLVFRIVSYWLPILPSWFFLQRLRRAGIV